MRVLLAVVLLASALLAVPTVHGQKAGLQENAKCPIKNRSLYNTVINNKNPPMWFAVYPDKKWFTAPTTSALHQAAYVFDAPRVKCLLTVAKFDPNIMVPFYDQPSGSVQPVYTPIPEQWALGAAISRLPSGDPSCHMITGDMIATILALLKAGANPNLYFYDANQTPLGNLPGLSCTKMMDPGILPIAKALVSAGAKVDVVADGGSSPLSTLVGFSDIVQCQDAVFKQLVELLVSHGADVDYAFYFHFENRLEDVKKAACPQFVEWIRKMADAQKARKASAAQKTSKEAAAQKEG